MTVLVLGNDNDGRLQGLRRLGVGDDAAMVADARCHGITGPFVPQIRVGTFWGAEAEHAYKGSRTLSLM